MRLGSRAIPRARTARRRPRSGLALALILALAGCGSSRTSRPATASPGAPEDPVVRAGDALSISVWPDANLGGQFPVEETGYIYLPILGAVRAADVPLSRLREMLREGYSSVIQNPVVTVTPQFRVSVLGSVRRPGLYTVTPTHSLFDVLSEAGGFMPDADEGEVRVVREGRVLEFDLERALETGEGLEMEPLRSGDRIVVPQGSGWTGARIRGILFALQSVLLVWNIWDRTQR
jgi:protein involved in polysaccharide export with SLBB domain